MRHLERSILLQVIDNRWREHLYDMDYLREGIHLRGFAQIDPLVAYKNEGFAMFEELMHSIWEEFSKLVFHAEIEVEPGQAEGVFAGNGARRADRARLLRRHAGGAALGAAAGGRRRRRRRAWRRRSRRRGGGRQRRRPSRSRPWSRTSTTKSAATTPAGAARGKKYKKCHGA